MCGCFNNNKIVCYLYAHIIIRQGMKKLLILIVAGALYFHYYPNEKLNNWLFEQKQTVLGYFSDATDTKVRLKSDKIYQDLAKDFGQFNSQEKDTKITSR